LPQDQGLGLLLVERQALRDGLGGVERIGGVGDGADGPPEGAGGRVFVRREPRAELPREALIPCGQGDGRQAGEVGGLKMVLRKGEGGGRGRMVSVFLKTRAQGREEREREMKLDIAEGQKSPLTPSLPLPAAADERRAHGLLPPLFFLLSAIAKRPNLDAAREFPRCSCPLKSPQVRQLDNFHRPIQRK
jgi:hypothetical protein